MGFNSQNLINIIFANIKKQECKGRSKKLWLKRLNNWLGEGITQTTTFIEKNWSTKKGAKAKDAPGGKTFVTQLFINDFIYIYEFLNNSKHKKEFVGFVGEVVKFWLYFPNYSGEKIIDLLQKDFAKEQHKRVFTRGLTDQKQLENLLNHFANLAEETAQLNTPLPVDKDKTFECLSLPDSLQELDMGWIDRTLYFIFGISKISDDIYFFLFRDLLYLKVAVLFTCSINYVLDLWQKSKASNVENINQYFVELKRFTGDEKYIDVWDDEETVTLLVDLLRSHLVAKFFVLRNSEGKENDSGSPSKEQVERLQSILSKMDKIITDGFGRVLPSWFLDQLEYWDIKVEYPKFAVCDFIDDLVALNKEYGWNTKGIRVLKQWLGTNAR